MKAAELDKLLFWISERESIRVKKEAGVPRPWTKDAILGTYRFCNVVRNDDRISIWIQKPMRAMVKNGLLERAAFNCLVARWFNEPETLDAISWPYIIHPSKINFDRIVAILKNRSIGGYKIFNAAYIINGAIGGKGSAKYETVVRRVLQPASVRMIDCIRLTSCRDSWAALISNVDGMGSFMAGQVVADWHAVGVIKGKDAMTWAPLGPGSKRGINILYGLDPNKGMTQDLAVERMQDVFQLVQGELPAIAKRMTLHDMQNCFCEFSKYRRGYGKQKYTPYDDAALLI